MAALKFGNKYAFAVLALLCTGAVHACMPGQNFDVYFSPDSAVVSAPEILRLANWTAEQRIKYPKQEVFQIDGRAEEREHNARPLAKARLQAVASILKRQRFNQIPMEEHTGIYRSGDVENGRRVEISVLPACPNPCCTGNEQ